MNTIIGKCSICGGRVVVPENSAGLLSPFCEECNATYTGEDPVLPMVFKKEQKEKEAIAIDFDGVIHSYVSGWQGAQYAPDPPVPGASEFIQKALEKGYEVFVCSTRAETPEGRTAIRNYLRDILPGPLFLSVRIEPGKPKAKIYIDDRGWRFEGTFPDLNTVDFTPWNKKEKK